MTFDCNLIIEGILPEASANAFLQSYQQTAQTEHYQQYAADLEQYFQDKVYRNARQNNIRTRDNSFFMEITSDEIRFISDGQNALKYEYGSGDTPPRRFVQPAVIDVANKISEHMISDAIEIYDNNTRFTTIRKNVPNLSLDTNYFNKYSRMLK